MQANGSGEPLRITTAALPPKQRLEHFREIYARGLFRFEMEPEPDTNFDVDVTLQVLPGLRISTGTHSAMRNRLTSELIDSDDLVLVILHSGLAMASQRGREEIFRDGQAIVTTNDEPARAEHSHIQVTNLRFERNRLSPQLADADAIVLRPLSRDNQALRLLSSYLQIVNGELGRSDASLRQAAGEHVHDLVALALGATRDAAEIARGRGVRIARLHAIKADTVAHVAASWLSIDALAARHGVSPRYIRSLFQGEETTFTDFVLNQRLARAHAHLTDPRLGERLISTIAFEAGFGDLSYFNHRFRQRYGATPSDIRAAARLEGGW